MALVDPPPWWDWELELTTHADQRMAERGIREVDLRAMLETARQIRPSTTEGRFVVETSHDGRNWEVVVEPDEALECIAVVTVYAVEGP
jgi:hypothetical protein